MESCPEQPSSNCSPMATIEAIAIRLRTCSTNRSASSQGSTISAATASSVTQRGGSNSRRGRIEGYGHQRLCHNPTSPDGQNQQDRDQQDHADGVLVGRRQEHGTECLDQPEQEPSPSIAPAMLPSPPSVAATNAFNPVMKPISKNAKNIESSMIGGARHHSRDCESVGHHPCQVRAHELRGLRILGHRLHGNAGAREFPEIAAAHP